MRIMEPHAFAEGTELHSCSLLRLCLLLIVAGALIQGEPCNSTDELHCSQASRKLNPPEGGGGRTYEFITPINGFFPAVARRP